MDEAKEKGGSVSIVTESSVTVSETVVETIVCEDQVQIEEGGEAGSSNGDDIMVEVLGSHVYVDGVCTADGGDGGVVGAGLDDEAVNGRDESGEAGSEGNLRSSGSESDVAGDLGSKSEVSGGDVKSQNEVNGAGVESSGVANSSAGGEPGENTDRTSGPNEGGGDGQVLETQRVGDFNGDEPNHVNRKTVLCSSAGSEDSSVQTKVVEEAAMMIDGEDLDTVDGARQTISDATKKAADIDADAESSDVKTRVSAEDIPHSEAKDSAYSCQSTQLVTEGQLDEKVYSNIETDKQGTDSEQLQVEVNTQQSTGNHATGNDQSLKGETVIDRGDDVDFSMGEAINVEKEVSDAKNVGFDAEQDFKAREDPVNVETMDVGTETHQNACDDSELSGQQTDVFVDADGVEASKADKNVPNQISPSVASNKVLNSWGNEDQLAENQASKDDSSLGQDMNVEEQVTGDEQDGSDQVREMEVEEHDSDSELPTSNDEKTVKPTTRKSVSAVKVHQAKYQLPSEEEGEFSVSDLVWGKVRSHPWWPGQIFDPSQASEKAVKYHKKDSFLVAYFGDRTFAWNEASLLKPFRTHFSQIEKLGNSESFQNAVNCALAEVSRRVELGLACSCIPPDVYDKIKIQKVENTGVRQESILRDGVDTSLSASSFKPHKLIDYMQALAVSPSAGGDRLDLVIAKAQLSAFYRLKGNHQLPEFQFCRVLSENKLSEEKMQSNEVIEHATPMDTDGVEISAGQETSRTQRSSYLKRKHNLKDGLCPTKKERSLSELMGETFDSPDGENGSDGIANKFPSSSSGKKRKAVDSFDSVMQEGRKTTPHFTKPSFKIGECIRRAASQMTGSPSILKSSSDRLQKLDGGSENPAADGYDVPIDNFEDAQQKRMNFATECSSLVELLSQLHLAACDPMKSHSSFNIIIDFFSGFRDSVVPDQLPGDKAGGKRKKSPNSMIGSPETFEFEDMNDTYWTDRIVQNGCEEHPSHGSGRGQYQIVPVELEKPIQKGRKSRKRYSDVNHDLTAEKPLGYVDERAPAELVMNFSEINSVPSETKLNKMFKHFGPLKESETEVDRETSRARVVFRRSSDAEVAYNSAGKFSIFGSVAVNYQLNYTISESFKASLYAPALVEETPLVASTLCGDHALVASTLGEETSLIASGLGEEASFMVSTLGEETLPIATSFHQEPLILASSLGEDTLAIPTTFNDGTSVIATTVQEETLPVATTMYEVTLPIATTAGEGAMAVTTTTDDQTFTVATTVGEQSSTIVTTVIEPTSTVGLTLVQETSSIASFGQEASTGPTTLGKETHIYPMTLAEETLTFPTTLDEKMLAFPMTLGEETPTIPTTLGEEASTIPTTLSEETPAIPATFIEKTPAIPATVSEETPAILPTFSEETPISATTGQPAQIIPTTNAEETMTIHATLGREITDPTTLHEETLAIPINSAEGTPTSTTTLCEETPAILATSSGENPAVPPTSSEENPTIPATVGQKTQTIPATISATLGKEITTVPTTWQEETLAIPMTFAEETPTITTTLSEETPVTPATYSEETPAIPATFVEETSTIPAAVGQQTQTIPTTMGEETMTIPATLGKETTTVSPTLHEETLAIPTISAAETSTISTTLSEETPTNPMTLVEETQTNPTTTGNETSATLTTMVEETLTTPTTLCAEASTVLTTSGEETSIISMAIEVETLPPSLAESKESAT